MFFGRARNIEIEYKVHRKYGASPGDTETVRIDYIIQRNRGYNVYKSEWVCPEHSGWARKKFEQWWEKCSDAPAPHSAREVVEAARSGRLLHALEITVRKIAGEKYDRIIAHKLGESLPELAEPTCGQCSHYAYGYCGMRPNHKVGTSNKICDDYLDLNYETDDEVPF